MISFLNNHFYFSICKIVGIFDSFFFKLLSMILGSYCVFTSFARFVRVSRLDLHLAIFLVLFLIPNVKLKLVLFPPQHDILRTTSMFHQFLLNAKRKRDDVISRRSVVQIVVNSFRFDTCTRSSLDVEMSPDTIVSSFDLTMS